MDPTLQFLGRISVTKAFPPLTPPPRAHRCINRIQGSAAAHRHHRGETAADGTDRRHGMASRAEDAPAPLPPSRRRYCRPNPAAASAASPRLLACQIPPPPPDLTAARLCVAAAAAARAAPFGALVQRFRLAGGPRPRFPVTPRPHFSHGRPAVMHDRAARCGTPAKRARQSGFCHAGANAAGNRCEFMPRRNRRRFVRSRVPSARRAAVQRPFPARSLLA